MNEINFRDVNINDANINLDEYAWIELDIHIGDNTKIYSCLGYVSDYSASTLSLENHNGPEGGLTLTIRDEHTVIIESNGDFGSVMTRVTITEAEMQALRRDLERITHLKGNQHIDLIREPVVEDDHDYDDEE